MAKNSFVITMNVSSLVSLINIFLFSAVYLFDSLDSILFNVHAYNWWGAFIIAQNATTITYIGIRALIRLRKQNNIKEGKKL
jgi:hypothetical protein